MRPIRVIATAAVMAACGGGDDETTPIDVPDPPPCAAGEVVRALGGCRPAGVPDDLPCPPGEVEIAGGGCRPAGIPPGGCAAGFETSTIDGGCSAILPAMPCPRGQLALPGETSCHAVAPCGSGSWGDIDTSGDVEYVDSSFVGMSDGGATAPWTTIGQGILAATLGATVAVAAGSYAEDVPIAKRVTVWGRCPEMVEIVGQGMDLAAVYLQGQANGMTLRGLAITGPDIGLLAYSVGNIIIEQVWVHDTGSRTADFESAGVIVTDSLFELGAGEGIFQQAGNVVVERSVVRDTQPEPSGFYGRGIGTQTVSAARAMLTVRDSIIERNHEVGIGVFGSDALIEATLVRDNLSMPADGTAGWGLWLNHEGSSNSRSDVTVNSSVIEGNHDAGIALVGSDALVDLTTVRKSLVTPGDPYTGQGVVVRNKFTTGDRAVLTMTSSLVSESVGVAFYVLGGDATVTGSVIQSTSPPPGPMPIGGRGMSVEGDTLSNQNSTLTLGSSVVQSHFDHGILVASADVVIDASVVRDIAPAMLDDLFGRGISVQQDLVLTQIPASATITASLVEGVHEGGVVVLAASATIQDVTVRDVAPRASDLASGRGVIIQYGPGIGNASQATITGLLVERSVEIGVFVAGSQVTLSDSAVRITAARNADQLLGDGISTLFGPSPTTLDVAGTRVDQSVRAAVSNFAGTVTLRGSWLDCNPIDLASQELMGIPHSFSDGGGNRCGCGLEERACKLSSATLEPPQPLPL